VKHFELISTDSRSSARAGVLHTAHGTIKTPVFMPVGTNATVKAVSQQTLIEVLDAEVILANTYHLHLRPGEQLISEAGGLHRFMNWPRPVLTDSGGYQVFSLASNRRMHDDGVHFQSHVDGSPHVFTPENVIRMQRDLGADIMMAFDECTTHPATEREAEASMHLTHRWLERCGQEFRKGEGIHGWQQFMYPIAQGSVHGDLRTQSAEFIAGFDLPGHAIGGLSVGESQEQLYEMTELCCGILPADKPRYLMGVGTPENLLRCISLGVDMFDCVLPTRNARNGQIFTRAGVINVRNSKWERDFSPIDPDGTTPASQYSKAYLRHLFVADEILGCEIATIHNLSFYLHLMRTAREKIITGDFTTWRDALLPKLAARI
jgi:queuine tRNA-ribosyltransferase